MTLTIPFIARQRLRNQSISSPVRGNAADVVKRLVAVQSQDYAGAKWSLGLRLRAALDAQVEEAFNKGEILRTHVMRPTWHFVLPQDIRWLLALTGPRIQAKNAGPYRRAGLEAATFRRAEAVLQKALQGGSYLTRDELRERLGAAGIVNSHAFRLDYVLAHAELEGQICSGPRRGRQFTYALLDERAPGGGKFDRADALTELAGRYFSSRGPARVQDFAKWSGLTIAEARAGLEGVASRLQRESLEGQEYWFEAPPASRGEPLPTAHLFSVFDEYISSYKGHETLAREDVGARIRAFGNGVLSIILLHGMIVGTWKRTLAKDSVMIQLAPFGHLRRAERSAVVAAAKRYAAFLGVRAVVS